MMVITQIRVAILTFGLLQSIIIVTRGAEPCSTIFQEFIITVVISGTASLFVLSGISIIWLSIQIAQNILVLNAEQLGFIP